MGRPAKFLFCFCLLLLVFNRLSHAADDVKSINVHFPAGSHSVSFKDSVKGDHTIEYRLEARAGQQMHIIFKASNPSASFNLLAPDGAEALHRGASDGAEFKGALPSDGIYKVQVYLMRSAARRKKMSHYTLTMTIAGGPNGAAREPDFSDGTTGGPDYWQVTGLKPNDSLKMHERPALNGTVILAFSEGAILRNLGCNDQHGARWCRVVSPEDPNVTGWVEARYLRESFNPPPLKDALVPGTHYHATGNVQCRRTADAPVLSCRFGVVRSNPGTAVVDITFPDGFQRTLYFSKGRVEAEIGVSLTTRHENDNTIVTIGENERYVIPGVILEGD